MRLLIGLRKGRLTDRAAGRVGSAIVVAALLAIAVVTARPSVKAGAPNNTVFHIGTFDRSSLEFAKGEPEHEVNFTVGRSTVANDWYARQPAHVNIGEASQEGKAVALPRAITFALDSQVNAVYRLRIALLVVTGDIPALRVTINGKQGTFCLHPIQDYSSGEDADAFYSTFSRASIEFDFPGSYLHRGGNQITLQAIDENAEPAPDSYFLYDALELVGSPENPEKQKTDVRIEPTIFYKNAQGSLTEDVDVFIRHSERINSATYLDLTIAGHRYHRAFEKAEDFGEEKLAIAVPEFPDGTDVRVSGRVGQHGFHQEQVIHPKKKWTLLLVPHIHLDVGFSDYQAKVASIQARVIDEALNLTEHHSDFRFSTDGEWSLEQFLRTRTPAEQQRAINAIRHGRLSVPANYANLLTGFPTAEVLLRSLYPSANLSREQGTPFDYATITDVPSFSWSYASILASAGVDYLLSGSNNYRAPVLLQGRLNQNSPFWWEGPDGGKVLLWYSRHYEQMQMLFGLPPVLSAGKDMLPVFLQQYSGPNYLANAVILYGTQVENTDLFPQQAELAQEWNSRFAYPRLKYSGFHEALAEVAKQFGNNIPTIRGDGGPYWEDGIGSDACYAAMERQNEGRGPSAEKLQTLTTLVNSRIAVDQIALRRMWKDMVLMDEHTWDSYDSVSDPTSMEAIRQLAVKDHHASEAQAQIEFLMRNAMATLTDSIGAGSGDLVVFNPLNWKRSGEVTFDLDKQKEVVDGSNGRVIPVEVLSDGPDFQHVRLVAPDVPAVGYKVFHLRPTHRPEREAEAVNATTLESPYYRIVLDPAGGAVRSIWDKQLQRELVNQKSLYRFGQYLYVTLGSRSPNQLLKYGAVYPKAEIQVHPAVDGRLTDVVRTPDGLAARMESTDRNTPKIATEIRLLPRRRRSKLSRMWTRRQWTRKRQPISRFLSP